MRRFPPRLTLVLLLCIFGAAWIFLVRDSEEVVGEVKKSISSPLVQGASTKPNSVSSRQLVTLDGHVIIGKRSWTLMTANSVLDTQFAEFIRTDIGKVFGHLNNYAVDLLPAVLMLGGFEFDRRVRFEGGTRYFPAVFMTDGFGCVATGRPEIELFVPDDVIDAYRKVWTLRTRNAAAFSGFKDFMGQLNSLATMPASEIRSMFLGANPSLRDQIRDIDIDQLRSVWGGKTYHFQSYLDIQQTNGTEFEPFGSLLGKIYWLESNRLRKLPPIILVGGRKWQFLVTQPVT